MIAPSLSGHAAEAQTGSVFLTDARLTTLKQRLANKIEPTSSAYLKLKADADAQQDRPAQAPKVWYVPAFYEDKKGHQKAKSSLEQDANGAYALALVYRMTGDEHYAKAAARFLHAWATTVEKMETREDSQLSFCYHFPALIFAADLIKNSPGWPVADQKLFQAFVREKALPMNTMARHNNWGNWGMVLVMASAAYLRDDALFQKAVARWKEFIEDPISDDGHLELEVHRNGNGDHGIWYSHFSLMPQTFAAEIARVNGVELYDYTSPSGRSLRKAFDILAPWAHKPATFPYFKAPIRRNRSQPMRSVTSSFSMPVGPTPMPPRCSKDCGLCPATTPRLTPHSRTATC